MDRLLAFSLGCCVALLAVAPGRAQTQDKAGEDAREPAGYRAAIDLAIQEHELNYFAEAREHFARAHALFPNARTLRGLGFADFELRHYVDAVKELGAALASETKPLEGPLRKNTEALLARAQLYVGEVRIALEPANTTLSVDGVAVDPGPRRVLLLGVGDHMLEFQAEGRVSQQRPLRVQGQQRLELRVTLPIVVATAASQQIPAANTTGEHGQSAEAPPKQRRVFTWVLGGATLAASGAVVGLAVAVQNAKKSFHACEAESGDCQHVAKQGTRLERSRNAMIGVASALAVATLVSFFVEGRARRSTQVSVGVSLAGLRVAGSF
jgi:hypothetical protein